MKIGLTNSECRRLIEMLFMAEWIMNAHKTEAPSPTDEYIQLEQKIYSLADRMGCQDLVEYDETLKEYFPTRLLEDGPAMQYIDEYNNDTFWDELLERLVRRDMVRMFGAERLARMTLEERWQAEDPVREKYATEFERKGIDRVEVMTFLPG
jgi:hypothetical protein